MKRHSPEIPCRGLAAQPRVRRQPYPGYACEIITDYPERVEQGIPSRPVCDLLNPFRVRSDVKHAYPGYPDCVVKPWAVLPNAFSVEKSTSSRSAIKSNGGAA
jgi:hypothetical protein